LKKNSFVAGKLGQKTHFCIYKTVPFPMMTPPFSPFVSTDTQIQIQIAYYYPDRAIYAGFILMLSITALIKTNINW
jgi:hypothetical protein